jgi:hypothetical protein
MGRVVQVPDTPEIRGMIAKVSHLVRVNLPVAAATSAEILAKSLGGSLSGERSDPPEIGRPQGYGLQAGQTADPNKRTAGDWGTLLWSFQAPTSASGFFGPVARPDRATVS